MKPNVAVDRLVEDGRVTRRSKRPTHPPAHRPGSRPAARGPHNPQRRPTALRDHGPPVATTSLRSRSITTSTPSSRRSGCHARLDAAATPETPHPRELHEPASNTATHADPETSLARSQSETIEQLEHGGTGSGESQPPPPHPGLQAQAKPTRLELGVVGIRTPARAANRTHTRNRVPAGEPLQPRPRPPRSSLRTHIPPSIRRVDADATGVGAVLRVDRISILTPRLERPRVQLQPSAARAPPIQDTPPVAAHERPPRARRRRAAFPRVCGDSDLRSLDARFSRTNSSC